PVVEKKAPAQKQPAEVAPAPAIKEVKPSARVQLPKRLTVQTAQDYIEDRLDREEEKPEDRQNPEMVVALLACRSMIESITENDVGYSVEERSDLRAFLLEEIAVSLPELKQFEKHMDAKKLAQSYYDRVVDWVNEGKYGKPPYFIERESARKEAVANTKLPRKFTPVKIDEILDRCDTIDNLGSNGRNIVGYLKGDERFTDSERQELLLHLSVRVMATLIKLNMKPEEARECVDFMLGARAKAPQPRKVYRENSDTSPLTEPSPSDSKPDPTESQKPDVSEEEKAERRRRDDELAAKKKAERAAKAAAKKDPTDPSYGQMKTVAKPQSKATRKDGSKKSGRNGKAA
ncbi:MAG: hypothetical protein NUV81_04280, partial [bacterium]|nr:hypothetical protein [bacterium]